MPVLISHHRAAAKNPGTTTCQDSWHLPSCSAKEFGSFTALVSLEDLGFKQASSSQAASVRSAAAPSPHSLFIYSGPTAQQSQSYCSWAARGFIHYLSPPVSCPRLRPLGKGNGNCQKDDRWWKQGTDGSCQTAFAEITGRSQSQRGEVLSKRESEHAWCKKRENFLSRALEMLG